MPAETLTAARILEAAEDVLRRYGPAKANVVDVARALQVSHGSVYRHFGSKAALRDAVAERWLAGISAPLEAIAAESAPAPDRLGRWLDLLVESKRSRALADPELFATYVGLAADARGVVKAHVETLVDQLARIISDGVAEGAFQASNAKGRSTCRLRRDRAFPQPRPRGGVVRPLRRRRLRGRAGPRPRRPRATRAGEAADAVRPRQAGAL